MIYILPAPKPPQGPQSRFHSLAQELPQFPFLSPLQAILRWSSKLSTQSPDSLTFKSLNMQGPLTEAAFFPLTVDTMFLVQFLSVFEKIHQSTSSSVSCHCQSPFSKEPVFLLTGRGALNSPHPDWAWLLSLTTLPPRIPPSPNHPGPGDILLAFSPTGSVSPKPRVFPFFPHVNQIPDHTHFP